jgi:hypothetical protein
MTRHLRWYDIANFVKFEFLHEARTPYLEYEHARTTRGLLVKCILVREKKPH